MTIRSARSRRRRRVVAALALTALLAAGAWGIAVALPRPLKTVTLRASAADIANPERGWFDDVDLLDPGAIPQARRDGVTIVRSYLRLDADRDAAIPDGVLGRLAAGFAAVRAAHLKVVLRVAYNAAQGQPDASLERIRQHAAQLKPVLARNADTVLSFEAGFIGAWGEWHDSTNGLAAPAGKAAVLRAALDAFPRSRMVALRYPADIRALLQHQVSAATAYDGSAKARVGSHQDCFLSSDPDDGGTWGQDGGSVAADKALVASLGRYTIVGGETCGVSARTTCPTALHDLSALHFTYLNRQFDAGALGTLRGGGCGGAIDRRLGYRLSVTTVGWTPKVSPGGTMTLELTVRNSGFAHVVNARPVELVLTRGSRAVTVRLHADPRTWAAGRSTVVREEVRLPAAVTKGTWSLALLLPDASARLASTPAFSIRLANAGTWDAATGRNSLHAKVAVG